MNLFRSCAILAKFPKKILENPRFFGDRHYFKPTYITLGLLPLVTPKYHKTLFLLSKAAQRCHQFSQYLQIFCWTFPVIKIKLGEKDENPLVPIAYIHIRLPYFAIIVTVCVLTCIRVSVTHGPLFHKMTPSKWYMYCHYKPETVSYTCKTTSF